MEYSTLEKAFEIYPEVKLIVVAHLYGTPGKMEEITVFAYSCFPNIDDILMSIEA